MSWGAQGRQRSLTVGFTGGKAVQSYQGGPGLLTQPGSQHHALPISKFSFDIGLKQKGHWAPIKKKHSQNMRPLVFSKHGISQSWGVGEIWLLILFINRLSSSSSSDSSGSYSLCSRIVKYMILTGLLFVKIEDLCLSRVFLCLVAK